MMRRFRLPGTVVEVLLLLEGLRPQAEEARVDELVVGFIDPDAPTIKRPAGAGTPRAVDADDDEDDGRRRPGSRRRSGPDPEGSPRRMAGAGKAYVEKFQGDKDGQEARRYLSARRSRRIFDPEARSAPATEALCESCATWSSRCAPRARIMDLSVTEGQDAARLFHRNLGQRKPPAWVEREIAGQRQKKWANLRDVNQCAPAIQEQASSPSQQRR